MFLLNISYDISKQAQRRAAAVITARKTNELKIFLFQKGLFPKVTDKYICIVYTFQCEVVPKYSLNDFLFHCFFQMKLGTVFIAESYNVDNISMSVSDLA